MQATFSTVRITNSNRLCVSSPGMTMGICGQGSPRGSVADPRSPSSPAASPQGFGQARNHSGIGGATEIDNFTKTSEQSGPREAECLTLRVPCQGTQGQVSQEPKGTGEEPPGLKVEGPPRRAWSRAQPKQRPRSPRPGVQGVQGIGG